MVTRRRIQELRDFITQEEDLFVLFHLGIPLVDSAKWRLEVTGLVERPLSLNYDDLRQFPRVELSAFHKCAGSPLRPTEPTPDRVGNVVWSGVKLADVLQNAGLRDDAHYVWATGTDFGAFDGSEPQHYQKDLRLDRLAYAEVLLATHLNGAPLTDQRGGPVRLVVPGYYGTNSVKWLTSLQVETGRSPSLFTTRLYNDQVTHPDGTVLRVPVWNVAPDSAIVYPPPGERFPAPADLTVSGWAWGDEEIEQVDVSIDAGRTWAPAKLDQRSGYSWQAFSRTFEKLQSGQYKVVSRAVDRKGQAQPTTGARNASIQIDIVVER
jgi:sulfane dehydrogenase subunit SoxC